MDDKPFPSVGELFHSLHSRWNALEEMSSIYHTQPRPTTRPYNARVKNQDNMRKITPNQTYLAQPPITCNFCNGLHAIQNCKKFLSLSVPERSKRVREKNLCSNCRRDIHSLEECTSGSCVVYHKKHHTLLHANIENSRQPN